MNMRTIYKYEIPVDGNLVSMPIDSQILSVGAQGESIVLWVEVDTERPECHRYFEVFGTGHAIPDNRMHSDMGVSRKFIGTVFMGPFVWHVYEYTGV